MHQSNNSTPGTGEAQTKSVPPHAPLARTADSTGANGKIHKINMAMFAALHLIGVEFENQGVISARTVDLARSIIKSIEAGAA